MSSSLPGLLRQILAAITRGALSELLGQSRRGDTAPRRAEKQRSRPASRPGKAAGRAPGGSGTSTAGHRAQGRASGTGTAKYAPVRNGAPDPGEVVWAWVPYEEDASRGKDRPVLVLDVTGGTVHALQLTSKDHDRDAAQEARAGRYWMDIGTGAWDAQGRPSEVRLNRLLTLDAAGVRREGAALDERTFNQVVAAARRYLG